MIYSAHTNLDNAYGGVNYKIAEKIGLKNLQVLEPKENSLQDDLMQAGAGIVGELDEPETELEFLKRIKKTFEVGCVRHNMRQAGNDQTFRERLDTIRKYAVLL